MSYEFFDSIEQGLKDALAFAAGDRGGVRVHRVRIDAPDVRRVRAKTGLSQEKFARAFRISVSTLRNWEQGRRRPEGPAAALLTAIDKRPREVLEALNAGRG